MSCVKNQLASITARQFFRIIAPKNWRGWVVMIRGYLDDTGADSRFVGFGGFIGKEESWTALEDDWNAENMRHGIPTFHAKEYPHLVPSYASVALKHRVFLVGYTVDLASYGTYSPPHRRRSPFGLNAFASAADGCAWGIFDWVISFPEEQVALVIDCQNAYQASVQDLINEQVAIRNFTQLHSTTMLNEKNKSFFPMRQVADLGANLTAKHTAARHYGMRRGKDLSYDFFCAHRLVGIVHADPHSIEIMADMFTDPNRMKYEFPDAE